MHDRETGLLNDALDREIADMLAVEPSAAFERRVRVRVVELALAPASGRCWRTAMRQGIPAAAVVLLALAAWRLSDAPERVGGSPAAQVAGTDLHPSALVPPGASSDPPAPATTAASVLRRTDAPRDLPTLGPSDPQTEMAVVRDWLPPVQVDPDEVAGMRALLADVQAGRFEMVVVSEGPAIAAPPSTTIAAPTRAATEGVPAVRASRDASADAIERGEADSGEPLRADGAADGDIEADRPPSQVASAAGVRPIVIAPVTIEPLVNMPEDSEGDAE